MRRDIETLPRIEEELVVKKKTVVEGRVEVSTHTDLMMESADFDLARQQVEVSRVQMNTVVDSVPHVRTEGDVTIVPVLEERLVVEKRLVLVEEVHIQRTSSTRNEKVDAVLRTQSVSIDRESLDETKEN